MLPSVEVTTIFFPKFFMHIIGPVASILLKTVLKDPYSTAKISPVVSPQSNFGDSPK